MWSLVKNNSNLCNNIKPVGNRKGWRTVRIFVSSTLRDFHAEQDLLDNEIFPDLRFWCETLKLRLIQCELKWIPSGNDVKSEPHDVKSGQYFCDDVKSCLSDFERCFEDKCMPFFLNVSGNQNGRCPTFHDFAANIALQYSQVYGLTLTETELINTELGKLTENSLFLTREVCTDDDSLDEISYEKNENDDDVSLGGCRDSYSLKSSSPTTSNSDFSDFSDEVLNFFRTRLEQLYPLDPSPLDQIQAQREAHKNYLDSRCAFVLGRDKMINRIEKYIAEGSPSGAPLMVVGIAGAGKSTLMAKCAHNTLLLAEQGELMGVGVGECKVFYHFVGTTPRSTDLASFLQRLTKEMKPGALESQTSLDSLVNLSYNLLESPTIEPVVIFVDAINQMDEDKHQYLKRWIPEKLSPNVRLILSTIEGTTSHQIVRSFRSDPTEIICGPLDNESQRTIVENFLQTYNKRLDEECMNILLDKDGSRYPLWLTLACEEIRTHRNPDTSLSEKIEALPDDLISLEETVFQRFEDEPGGELMKACLCLLEVSRHGLLETELLALLAEQKNIELPEFKEDEGELGLGDKDADGAANSAAEGNIREIRDNISKLVQETYVKSGNESSDDNKKNENNSSNTSGNKRTKKSIKFLPPRQWAVVYRNLKPLLRPCGDLGEGRLDFYHRSLSKAVRKRYFTGNDAERRHKYNFWHGVLADFFEGLDDVDRKAEELPYHLEQLLDNNRLIHCLMDWEVFDRIYSDDFSIDLLHSWQTCGGYGVATAVYNEQLANLRSSDMPLVEYVDIVERVYGFLIQAGQYREALELMEARLNEEITQLGERPLKMADIYQNMARCKSEIDKAEQFVHPSQLRDNELILEYGRKSLDYRRKVGGPENDYKCALANILIAHHLSNVADLTQDVDTREQSFQAIEEAIPVFTELGDIGHIAECLMTKAIIDYNAPFSEREKLLLKALGTGKIIC